MYQKVETDHEYTMENGEVCHPVATLADEYGGRAQIDIDDHCYVLRLKQAEGAYRTVTHIFPEALDVMVHLPRTSQAKPE